MATVGTTKSGLVDKLTWYNAECSHTMWDRFSTEDQERMLSEDMSAGTGVSLLLGSVMAAGLLMAIVSLAIVLLTQ